jgi:hypothetical protein
MTCSRNLFKHSKNCYQTKTNRKMSQHDFYFFANLMIFFSQKKKVTKIFSFHIYFSHLWKISNPKNKIKIFMTDVFECFNHIVTFWKIFSYFLLWWLWQKWIGLGAHLRRWQRKQNVKIWMWIFYNQMSMNHLT